MFASLGNLTTSQQRRLSGLHLCWIQGVRELVNVLPFLLSAGDSAAKGGAPEAPEEKRPTGGGQR